MCGPASTGVCGPYAGTGVLEPLGAGVYNTGVWEPLGVETLGPEAITGVCDPFIATLGADAGNTGAPYPYAVADAAVSCGVFDPGSASPVDAGEEAVAKVWCWT